MHRFALVCPHASRRSPPQLFGMGFEHGPFLAQQNGTLILNPLSWNSAPATVVYIEQPAGVGFSYSSNPDDYLWGYNDTVAATDNAAFLSAFFDCERVACTPSHARMSSIPAPPHYPPACSLPAVQEPPALPGGRELRRQLRAPVDGHCPGRDGRAAQGAAQGLRSQQPRCGAAGGAGAGGRALRDPRAASAVFSIDDNERNFVGIMNAITAGACRGSRSLLRRDERSCGSTLACAADQLYGHSLIPLSFLNKFKAGE